MKTSVAVGISSLLGFALTFAFVPQRAEGVPPTWFELPGSPLTVDGQPVTGWKEANKVLRDAAYHSYSETPSDAARQQPEREGREVRVTYTRRSSDLFGGPQPVESVVVRTFLPITIEYSRAMHYQLVRYEIVRPETVD